jgi:uncharacterized protein
MLTISQLYIYPIKSMGGIAVNSAIVTDRGLQYDRRWILVDKNNDFLTQREFPIMALLHVAVLENNLIVTDTRNISSKIEVPFLPNSKRIEKVVIWNAVCEAFEVGEEISHWFSKALDTDCKLMYMPEATMRPVDTTSGYHPEGKFTSFADAYPFLLLSEESVSDLNERLENKVLINRFRPNIVFTGGKPYCEDDIEDFTINGVEFTGLENCGRCGIITINQENPQKSNEPLKTLSKYRMQNKNIVFGRNTVHSNTGIIHVGDELKLK